MKASRIFKGALVASAVLAAAFVGVSPAHAAAPAPSCIARWAGNDWISNWAKARNDCGVTKKVKIIIAAGDDSGCKTLSAGQTMTHRFAVGIPNGVVLC